MANNSRTLAKRFACPSAPLALRSVGRQRFVLQTALLLALAAHLSLTRWESATHSSSPTRPLTTQFVKREPRLTKPLEMRKRPSPKRRMMQRKVVAIKARVSRKHTTISAPSAQVMGKLAQPDALPYREVSLAKTASEPQAVAASIQGTMQPKESLDTSLEMVDVQALDTGQYQAMVIQDPTDKRLIKGFFHFYRAYPASSIQDPDKRNTYQAYQNEAICGLANVVAALNRFTSIRSDVKGSIQFDSAELFKTPWVYHLGVSNFKLTPSEAQNLGQYIRVGGLFFADTIYYGHDARGDPSNRSMIQDALTSVGIQYERDWQFAKLPGDHPIYHCFFDFDSLPAGGHEPFRRKAPYNLAPWVHYLEGVVLGGRVLAIVCKKWYAKAWGEWGPGEGQWHIDNRRQLQFGVNIVVLALTQEGSITNRVMDAVR